MSQPQQLRTGWTGPRHPWPVNQHAKATSGPEGAPSYAGLIVSDIIKKRATSASRFLSSVARPGVHSTLQTKGQPNRPVCVGRVGSSRPLNQRRHMLRDGQRRGQARRFDTEQVNQPMYTVYGRSIDSKVGGWLTSPDDLRANPRVARLQPAVG